MLDSFLFILLINIIKITFFLVGLIIALIITYIVFEIVENKKVQAVLQIVLKRLINIVNRLLYRF